MPEREKVVDILSREGLIVRKQNGENGTVIDILRILRLSERSGSEIPPISFWQNEGKAIIRVNYSFANLKRRQRDAALLFVHICLDGENIPERVIWDFDTKLPPDKLEGIVTYTPHRAISSVLSS